MRRILSIAILVPLVAGAQAPDHTSDLALSKKRQFAIEGITRVLEKNKQGYRLNPDSVNIKSECGGLLKSLAVSLMRAVETGILECNSVSFIVTDATGKEFLGKMVVFVESKHKRNMGIFDRKSDLKHSAMFHRVYVERNPATKKLEPLAYGLFPTHAKADVNKYSAESLNLEPIGTGVGSTSGGTGSSSGGTSSGGTPAEL